MMKLVIIMPAYNESSVIGGVIKGIPATICGEINKEVIVINDNSTDDTSKIARSAGAKVLTHRINLGAGGATMTGLEYALRVNADIAITMDSDGQHDPKDIEKMVQKVIDGYDLVIGSRLNSGVRGDMPFYKLIGNKLLNIVTFMLYGTWVSDSQSGFKAFSREAIIKCKVQNVGYEFCSEMIGQARAAKLKICEVPIKAIYSPYSKGKGQHYLNGFNIILKLTLNKILGNQ